MGHIVTYTSLGQQIIADLSGKTSQEIVQMIESIKTDLTNQNIQVDLDGSLIPDLPNQEIAEDDYFPEENYRITNRKNDLESYNQDSSEDCQDDYSDNFSNIILEFSLEKDSQTTQEKDSVRSLEDYIPAKVFEGIDSLRLRCFNIIFDDYLEPLTKSTLKEFHLYRCYGPCSYTLYGTLFVRGLPILPVEKLSLDTMRPDFYPILLKDFPNLKKIDLNNIHVSRIAYLLPKTVESLEFWADGLRCDLSPFADPEVDVSQIKELNVDFCSDLSSLHPFENCYRISAKECFYLTKESILSLNCAYLDLSGGQFTQELFDQIGQALALKGELIEMIDADLGPGGVYRVDQNQRQWS